MIKALTQIMVAAILVVAVWSVSVQWAWAQGDPLVNTQVNKYVNEDVRTLCETVRALKARLDSSLLRWYLIADIVPNDATLIVDPAREDEGLTPLTGADIHSVMYNLTVIQNTLDTEGVDVVIEKPCVRSLEVSR